jgi:RimJ/RimL family protein N-acetyltransferase
MAHSAVTCPRILPRPERETARLVLSVAVAEVRHRTPHLRIDVRLTLHGMEWPLFDLRLRIGDVALRPVTDADLPAIAAMFPDDDEQDPRWEHFAGLSAQRNRHRLLVQRTWLHRGSWSPSSWCLDLAVEVSGELVGLQALEAGDFAKLRTVDSGSWLAVQARGRGTAVAMRTAILGLAFDHLGAVAAISSARVDNAPSLAVSRRWGTSRTASV